MFRKHFLETCETPVPGKGQEKENMSDFSKIFQRMDETIADVCLRELDWSRINTWDNEANNQNIR